MSIILTQNQNQIQNQAQQKARNSRARGFPSISLPYLGKSAEVVVAQILHPR